MDYKTNVKPEDPPSDNDLPNEKALSTSKITISGNEFETYNKRSIKVEANVNLRNERWCFSKNFERDIKNDTITSNYDFELDSKINIKEEPIVSDTELPNEKYFECTRLATKMKNDTIIKTEIDCQLEGSCIHDISQGIENKESDLEAAEDLPSSESPRFSSEAVYHGVSFHSFLDASVNGKNVGKETSMRSNICSLKYDPACDSERFEIGENVGDESKLYKCTICEKNYCSRWSLNRHSLVHSQRKSYKCDICEKNFTDRSSFNRHTLVHSSTKPYKCEHCEKGFTRNANLKEHKLVHSGTKPYKCNSCDKCFIRKSHLERHKLLHLGIKPYKCEHCDKRFTEKSDLKTHTLVHLGTRAFKCEHCDKYFLQKSQLNRHILVHSGTKPYKCEHCEKCFKHKSHLITHTWIHSGTKAYKCEHCEKCFTQKSVLKTHTLVHTGTKPYKCEHCDRCFIRKSHLKSHALIHSGNK